ncbi:uracil-DNA glycosylase family protein [Antarcticibacterium arcticum]|uniref:Uracil-DNA glycosylase family protein n=1 Tax=Antarcticibacterium arcticum TaxID=2585771 RepID=A0A5B8YNE8_9FLAO|nr:uracil-DNA glycosylase family protein [Antarcticibacterium arcticum]QED39021.1 uracil-DNA glycosylase family protein [Antarcticibacterium arcticum]
MQSELFHHIHPYGPFIPENATKLIVGTLPPPRFTTGDLKEGDVDFCYGSRDGMLWVILDKLFDLNLTFENTARAIEQREQFLIKRGIGICDMVESSRRAKIDASDLGMQQVEMRNMLEILRTHPKIETLLFTGGNSKNGPEYFFRRHLKESGENFNLKVISNEIPRIHQFVLDGRLINTVSLIAPSGSANRAIGSLDHYKKMKIKDPEFNTIDFRILQYKGYF